MISGTESLNLGPIMSCKMKHIERDDRWCLRISLKREQSDYANVTQEFSRSVGEVDILAHFGHLISAVLLVEENHLM